MHLALPPSLIRELAVRGSRLDSLGLIYESSKGMQAWEEDQTHEKLSKVKKTAKIRMTCLLIQKIVTNHQTPKTKVANSSLSRQIKK